MKINYLFLIVTLLALGCNEGPKQERSPTEGSKTEQTDKSSEATTNELKQNGDYSSLFNSQDCKVITAEEISTSLGVAFVDMNIKALCSFKSELPNNKTWYLGIVRNDMSKSDIQREIQSFKSDETGLLSFQMSETGDTYLCNQHSHGYLSIYNPNYTGSVVVSYGSVAESRDFTKEERLEHRDLALTLANTLLKKHQK
jgi:hypothetical protein